VSTYKKQEEEEEEEEEEENELCVWIARQRCLKFSPPFFLTGVQISKRKGK